MKNILFVLPSLTIGGLERVQVTLANALAKAGHNVTVITFDEGEDLAKELLPEVTFRHVRPKPHPIMQKIPYVRDKFYDSGLWETRASAKELYRYYVGKEQYDVEIAFFRGRSVKIISGSTNPNSVKLAWVHNDYTKCGGVTANFKSLDDLKKAYKAFDGIVAVSKEAAEKFRIAIGYAGSVSVLYNPIPAEEILHKATEPCELKKDRFTVVAVGRLVQQKGFDRLVDAFVAAKKKTKKDAALWIVGEGEDRPMLEQKISESGDPSIRLLGAKTNPFPYMAQTDLCVCSSRFEGFNLTVAEALILGKPVLSTVCTGPCEILEDGKYGLLCENSTEGLTDALSAIFSDPEKLDSYRALAAERGKFFNADRVAGTLLELLKQFPENPIQEGSKA